MHGFATKRRSWGWYCCLAAVICSPLPGCGKGASKGITGKVSPPDRWSQGQYRHWAPDLFFDDPKVIDLCNAIAEKDYQEIDRLVKVDGVNINATGRMKVTPLFWAFPLGYAEAFEKIPRDAKNFLVDSEIAPTQREYMGKHAKPMEHLLKLGADPNTRTVGGNVVVVGNQRKPVYVPGSLFEVSQALSVTHLASQPLGHARFNYFPIIMANGGDPRLTDKDGLPLILYACGYGYRLLGAASSSENVAILIDAGADLEARDREGHTPILVAAKGAHFDAVYMLIHAGADFRATNNSWRHDDLASFVCEYMRSLEKIPEKHREFAEKNLPFTPRRIDPYFLEVAAFLEGEKMLQEDAHTMWRDRIDQLVDQHHVSYGQRDSFVEEWVARGSYHATLAARADSEDRGPLNGPFREEALRLITQAEMESLASKRDPLGAAATWIRKGRDPASAREEAVRLQVHYAVRALASRKNSGWTLVPPELSAEDMETLAEVIAVVESRSNTDVEVAVDPLAIYQIRSQILADLFPETTFVVVPWHTRKRPTSDSPMVVPMFTASTFAIESDDTPVHEFAHSGKYEEFGNYLKAHNVVIRYRKEAARVWEAFCAIHNKQWPDGKHRDFPGNTWRLNEYTRLQGWDSRIQGAFSRFDSYYEIFTDSEERVYKGKLEVKERRPPPIESHRR